MGHSSNCRVLFVKGEKCTKTSYKVVTYLDCSFHTLLDEIYPRFMFITGVFLLPLLQIFSGHWTATI